MFAVAMKWYAPQCSAEPAGHDNYGHAGAADDNGEQCNTRQPESAKMPKKADEKGVSRREPQGPCGENVCQGPVFPGAKVYPQSPSCDKTEVSWFRNAAVCSALRKHRDVFERSHTHSPQLESRTNSPPNN